MNHNDNSSLWRSRPLRAYAYALPEDHPYPSVDQIIPIIQKDPRSDDQLADELRLPIQMIRHYRQLLGSPSDPKHDSNQSSLHAGLEALQQQYDAIVHMHYHNVYRAEHLKGRYLESLCQQMQDDQPLRPCDLAFIKHASKVEY
ncbi:hypothetical protein PVA45_07750 (plasmid) [Entomospira entomophila]|uniref:Uncharacterized protein n=1 Tax=Entomospira entomophila TaxID=2719988 RepID=A0A968GAA0_9SPIO|nr:hypothetical protein [Entomospira entomophilus]NIZ41397.1 hypothetical protein [Entomospira entomophilus]WDI36347.1 hypothetical protein PVA45_07750 [Entomospira entomophilus]